MLWSSVRFLLEALRRVAEGLESERAVANRAKRQLQNNKIRTLTTGLPAFSDFGPAFRAAPTSPDGDVRGACYAGYHDTDGEFIPLDQAAGLLRDGRRHLSTTLVLVPGQSVSEAIIDFLIKLDVKEIHGYRPDLGPLRLHRRCSRSDHCGSENLVVALVSSSGVSLRSGRSGGRGRRG